MIVLIRGGGDLASGVALRLHPAGLQVVITELPQPLAVRRLVSFSEGIYAGQFTLEGVTARSVDDPTGTLRREERPAGERSYAGGMHIGVRVDDVDAQHARLARAGVAVSPLVNQPWGERNFRFVDPDGYEWVYGQA